MAEPPNPHPTTLNPDTSSAERAATTNRAAFSHWLRAVHGITLDSTLRAWAEADPPTATTLILQFSGPGFAEARLAAGLLLQADLRPDDRILVLAPEPDWLSQALAATSGRARTTAEATVLIADHRPRTLPPRLRRMILIAGASATLPPEITVSRPEDWAYP